VLANYKCVYIRWLQYGIAAFAYYFFRCLALSKYSGSCLLGEDRIEPSLCLVSISPSKINPTPSLSTPTQFVQNPTFHKALICYVSQRVWTSCREEGARTSVLRAQQGCAVQAGPSLFRLNGFASQHARCSNFVALPWKVDAPLPLLFNGAGA
jgi:hypothetical protein